MKHDQQQQPIRFGILGAASIAPRALIWPVLQTGVPEVQVSSVAARDPARAEAFARKNGLPRVHPSYQALVEDPEIDAVYIALPNSLHAPWTIRALEAGKHVLCEKPLASNADEAQQVASVAARNPERVLMEAVHYRYHPVARRAKEILASGEIGTLRSIDVQLCVPLLRRGDIRFRYELAGGAVMDLGCYCIDLIRFLSGEEPSVTAARARRAGPQIDRAMEVEFTLPGTGATARMFCSLRSSVLLRLGATITGERGTLRLVNPFLPHFYHRLDLHTDDGVRRSEKLTREPTYHFQLRAFVDAVRGGGDPVVTDATGAVANMQVVDAVYRKAGMKPRGM